VQTLLEKFEDIGTYAEIKEALETARDRLVEYVEIGTPEEIKEAFTQYNTVLDGIKEENTKKEVDELVAKFGITEDKAASLLTKMELKDAMETLAEMAEAVKVTGRYRKPITEDHKEEKKDNKREATSRISKLYESMGR
jgi:hypothetical protein